MEKTFEGDIGSEIVGSDEEGVEQITSRRGHLQSEELLRRFVMEIVKKCAKGDRKPGKAWCLYTHDGERVLGRHPSEEAAFGQERAIKAHGG